MSRAFPIYRVEIDLHLAPDCSLIFERTYEETGEVEVSKPNVAQCRQDMMIPVKYPDHLTAQVSLYRMMTQYAEMLGVLDYLQSWDGCIYLDRYDSWCPHWNSHYTYRRFNWNPMDDFREYYERHPEEFEADVKWEDFHVCGCDVCKSLNRTMILHLGTDKCPTCLSIS